MAKEAVGRPKCSHARWCKVALMRQSRGGGHCDLGSCGDETSRGNKLRAAAGKGSLDQVQDIESSAPDWRHCDLVTLVQDDSEEIEMG